MTRISGTVSQVNNASVTINLTARVNVPTHCFIRISKMATALAKSEHAQGIPKGVNTDVGWNDCALLSEGKVRNVLMQCHYTGAVTSSPTHCLG